MRRDEAGYAVASVADIDAVALPTGLKWHPVRLALGVRAFGVSGFSAGRPGETVVEPHSETRDGRGHEELYVVLRGAAHFSVGGSEFDTAAGSMVLVSDPHLHRAAVALEPNTTVLAFGGPSNFEPAGSEWLELARAHLTSAPAKAKDILEQGLREVPESAAIRFGFAMVAAARGSPDEALVALCDAIHRDPRLRAEVDNEDLLAPLAARLD